MHAPQRELTCGDLKQPWIALRHRTMPAKDKVGRDVVTRLFSFLIWGLCSGLIAQERQDSADAVVRELVAISCHKLYTCCSKIGRNVFWSCSCNPEGKRPRAGMYARHAARDGIALPRLPLRTVANLRNPGASEIGTLVRKDR